MNRVIYHIDVNSAFLSWEAVYRLKHKGGTVDLREEVSAVGGDIAMRHGIILAKSIPAKKYKIQTGDPVTDALKKCPQLKLVPPNYGLYEKCSAAFMNILREYSDLVEQYSIDEAFLDVSKTCHLFGTPEETARLIKNRIRDELGFTVNVGISENKLLAKMASDFQKPDKVHALYPWEIHEKMWGLLVSDLFFVGGATTKKLLSYGIRTIGELAQSDPAFIKGVLKKQGEVVWNFANGLDFSPVISTPPQNKGYGNSTTVPFDVVDEETAQKVLLSLAETVGKRLRADSVQIRVVSVGIRYFDLSYVSHQKMLSTPTNIKNEIYHAACEVFSELWNHVPIRHLGIHTAKVEDEEFVRQISLFDEADYEKMSRADRMADEIRKRFGNDAIKRAVFAEDNKVDHMSGGISREKRTVDYSKVTIE